MIALKRPYSEACGVDVGSCPYTSSWQCIKGPLFIWQMGGRGSLGMKLREAKSPARNPIAKATLVSGSYTQLDHYFAPQGCPHSPFSRSQAPVVQLPFYLCPPAHSTFIH